MIVSDALQQLGELGQHAEQLIPLPPELLGGLLEPLDLGPQAVNGRQLGEAAGLALLLPPHG